MSEAVDLSFLSDVEKDLILQVLQRDEELRKAEERRIRWGCVWAGRVHPGGGWRGEDWGWLGALCRSRGLPAALTLLV